MYMFKSRVRYSETDMDAKLSVTGLMNYFQDCSTFHSEDSGVGISYLEEERKGWLLSSWQIVIHRRPRLGEEITVKTWPYEAKGIFGMRNFTLHGREGELLAAADSCWFLVDASTGKPVRVGAEDVAAYGDEEPRFPMERAPRKIALPENLEEKKRIPVMKHQLDTNRHVNNAQYVDMAMEVLPEGARVKQIRAEYKKAAVLGDTMALFAAESGDTYVISLRDPEGGIFANVELKVNREDERHD